MRKTKKNHKRVVSLHVIDISHDLLRFTKINLNFDFFDLYNVFFEKYLANELTRSIVFEAI